MDIKKLLLISKMINPQNKYITVNHMIKCITKITSFHTKDYFSLNFTLLNIKSLDHGEHDKYIKTSSQA